MVLIDIGASMSSKSGFGGVSFVETAKQAAWELLRTLAPGDFVNIVAFDSNNATEILFPLVMQFSSLLIHQLSNVADSCY